MKRTFAAFCTFALLVTACAHQFLHEAGGPYYFETFADNYSVPYTPKGEITEAQAQAHEAKGESYCIAWFNEQGLVSQFEKRLHSKPFFTIRYTYNNGKLVELQGVNADGKESVQRFEPHGA